MSALEQPFYTPEQYLELERKAETKSEYYGGQIFAMSGGSDAHSLIGGNIHGLFWSHLRGKPCRAFNSDMQIKVSPTGLYTYPDVSVVCGEVQFADGRRDILGNPAVIVEVLSPSTESYDRGEKFVHYQRLSSLTDYLLVSQKTMRVEQYVRQANNQWLLTVHSGPEATAYVASVDCDLRLAEVYEKVEAGPEGYMATLRVLGDGH